MATCKRCGGDSFVDMTALRGDVVAICMCCGQRDDSIDEPREPPMERLTTWSEALQRVRESKAALARDLAEKARCRGGNPMLIEYLEARASVASMEAEHGAGLPDREGRVRFGPELSATFQTARDAWVAATKQLIAECTAEVAAEQKRRRALWRRRPLLLRAWRQSNRSGWRC